MRKTILFLSIFAVSIPVLCFAVTNGSFEVAPGVLGEGWLTWSVDTKSQVAGQRTGGSGTYVWELTDAGGGSLYQTETSADASETWRVQGWIYLTTGATASSVGWFDSVSPYAPATTNVSITNIGTWETFSVNTTFTAAPAGGDGTGYRDVQVNFSGTVRVDDWETTDLTPVMDWCFY
jgi:hypothetical protein